MAIQVALALVVLIAAGLFLRSFIETRDTDPGFRREGVLLAAYDLTGRTNRGRLRRARSPAALLERLRALPAVEGAAIASSVPLDIHGLPSRVFTVEGRARDRGRVRPGARQHRHARLLRGHGHSARGGQGLRGRSTTRRAAAGDRQRGVRPPLPRRASSRSAAASQARGRSYLIAGVVRNSLYNAFGEPPTPIIYFSYPRPAAARRRDSPAHARRARRPPSRRTCAAPCASSIPSCRSTTSGRWPTTSRRNLIFRRIPARMFAVLGAAAAAARGDRHLRGGRLHRVAAHDRDRRAPRARRDAARASSAQFVRREPAGHRRRRAGRLGRRAERAHRPGAALDVGDSCRRAGAPDGRGRQRLLAVGAPRRPLRSDGGSEAAIVSGGGGAEAEATEKIRHEDTKRTETHEENQLAWSPLHLVAPRFARSDSVGGEGSRAPGSSMCS